MKKLFYILLLGLLTMHGQSWGMADYDSTKNMLNKNLALIKNDKGEGQIRLFENAIEQATAALTTYTKAQAENEKTKELNKVHVVRAFLEVITQIEPTIFYADNDLTKLHEGLITIKDLLEKKLGKKAATRTSFQEALKKFAQKYPNPEKAKQADTEVVELAKATEKKEAEAQKAAEEKAKKEIALRPSPHKEISFELTTAARKILGVSPETSLKDIGHSFRMLAKGCYDNPEQFKRIVSAYELLTGKSIPQEEILLIKEKVEQEEKAVEEKAKKEAEVKTKLDALKTSLSDLKGKLTDLESKLGSLQKQLKK